MNVDRGRLADQCADVRAILVRRAPPAEQVAAGRHRGPRPR